MFDGCIGGAPVDILFGGPEFQFTEDITDDLLALATAGLTENFKIGAELVIIDRPLPTPPSPWPTPLPQRRPAKANSFQKW